MPGATSASAGAMSEAERVKFGSASGPAPGAKAASDVDVTHAERVK